MRRRASSPAATMRAREARSSARAAPFETAVATSSVNACSRASALAGRRVPSTRIAPQVRPSTTIGAVLQALPPLQPGSLARATTVGRPSAS